MQFKRQKRTIFTILDQITNSNKELINRREELKSTKEKRDEAYDKYMCELNGTCGTGKLVTVQFLEKLKKTTTF